MDVIYNIYPYERGRLFFRYPHALLCRLTGACLGGGVPAARRGTLPSPTERVSLLGVQIAAVLLAVIKIRFKRLFVNDMNTNCYIVGSCNTYYANQSVIVGAVRQEQGRGCRSSCVRSRKTTVRLPRARELFGSYITSAPIYCHLLSLAIAYYYLLSLYYPLLSPYYLLTIPLLSPYYHFTIRYCTLLYAISPHSLTPY